jgi:hypothetical protein
MRNYRVALLVLTASVAFAAPVFADNDPTMQQIYDEAKSGHVDQAQQMINQVLRDHPRSAKAHYVAAELAAKQGNMSVARGEFGQAEQLEPGLPFAKPQAVQALKAELGLRAGGGALLLAPQQHTFPWLPVLLLVGMILVVWTIVRRRSAAVAQIPGGYPPGGMPMGAAPGPYGGPGVYGGQAGGGIGSGIAGGLASGLAVGAGVVAGEELARHFLDGGQHEGAASPAHTEAPPSNDDLGGSDFGVNDPGSWDDSGGGGDGGGDWS